MDSMQLGFGTTFSQLAARDGLVRLDRLFLQRLQEADGEVHGRLLAARAAPEGVEAKAEGELVIAVAPHLEAFVADLFGIEAELAAVAAATRALDPVHACKRLFVQRQAVKEYADPSGFDGAALRARWRRRMGEALTRTAFAGHVKAWEAMGDAEALDVALRYAAWATLTRGGTGGASRRHDVPGAAEGGPAASGAGADRRARRRDHDAAARA